MLGGSAKCFTCVIPASASGNQYVPLLWLRELKPSNSARGRDTPLSPPLARPRPCTCTGSVCLPSSEHLLSRRILGRLREYRLVECSAPSCEVVYARTSRLRRHDQVLQRPGCPEDRGGNRLESLDASGRRLNSQDQRKGLPGLGRQSKDSQDEDEAFASLAVP